MIKILYKQCINENKLSWFQLTDDVQNLIKKYSAYAQYYDNIINNWVSISFDNNFSGFEENKIYRLNPSIPHGENVIDINNIKYVDQPDECYSTCKGCAAEFNYDLCNDISNTYIVKNITKGCTRIWVNKIS